MPAESLRARVQKTILLTFAVLTTLIASATFFALNRALEADLKARAEVIGRALSQSDRKRRSEGAQAAGLSDALHQFRTR